jgi:hypothetical protein
VEINILRKGKKGVTNCIIGSNAFVAMKTTEKVDTQGVDGMCAHIEKCLQLKDGVIQVAYEVLCKN